MSAPPSFWLDTCGERLTPRRPLPGDADADVAIVGAGYTGLWTAFHLLRADPTLRVVVLEAEIAGWGASGTSTVVQFRCSHYFRMKQFAHFTSC